MLTLSPFLLVLLATSIPVFVKVYFVAHSALGAAGAVLLGRRLGLSPVLAVALAALGALNPWMMQHYAVGYSPFVSVGLVPWVAYLLLDPRRRTGALLGAAALAALMVYQGALHLYVWLLITVGVATAFALLLARRRDALAGLGHSAAFLGLALALALPKLVFVGSEFIGVRRGVSASFGSLGELAGLLTDTAPIVPFATRHGVYFWDGSLYVGWWLVLLALAALGAGGARALLERRSRLTDGTRRTLVAGATALVWLALGWGTHWATLARWLPWLDVEVYPYRFLFPAVVLAIAAVLLQLDAAVRRWPLGGRAGWLAAAVLLPTLAGSWTRYQAFAELATSRDPRPILERLTREPEPCEPGRPGGATPCIAPPGTP